MNIDEIEKLTYEKAMLLAEDKWIIKDYKCLFVDFNNRFGYSVLIFKNNKHIYYANDYELHHSNLVSKRGTLGLKEFYIKTLNKKLFTNKELLQNIKSYDEYEKKNYFLRNYWIMQYDYVSIFDNNVEEKKKQYIYYNPYSFCYVKDEKIINEQKMYMDNILSYYDKLIQNNKTFREMVSCELSNHEAGYTGSSKEALQSLGLLYENLNNTQKHIVDEELRKQIKNCY